MFKHDYLEDQIEALCKTIAAVLFGSDSVKKLLDEHKDEEKTSAPMREKLLELQLRKLLDCKQVEEARDLIFAAVREAPNFGMLVFALNGCNKMLAESLLPEAEIEKFWARIRELYVKDDR